MESTSDPSAPMKAPPFRRRGVWITLGILILLVAGFTVSYRVYMSRPLFEYETDRIKFTVAKCAATGDLFTPTQFLVREWAQDGTFNVKALEGDDCGVSFSSAAFRVTGDSLTLEYRTLPPDYSRPRPACYCRYELAYMIKGLEKKNWNVEIRSPDLPEHVYVTRNAGGRATPPPSSTVERSAVEK